MARIHGQERGQEKLRKELESGAGVRTMPWPQKDMEPLILRLELKHQGALPWNRQESSSR